MGVRNYFYARVSTTNQNENRQLDEIEKLRKNNIEIDDRDVYVDKISGIIFERPELDALKRSIRENDVLYLKSIDRLGRNKTGILEQWSYFTERGVHIVILDMPLLDTRKYKEIAGVGELITDLVLQILAWLAEEEKTNINTRQREGIAAAKLRNVKFGRPRIEPGDNFINIYNDWKNKKITARRAMELLNIKANTFYRRVAEYENRSIGGVSDG